MSPFTRRSLLISALAATRIHAQQNKDWLCPMDPEVRSEKPGLCPRCGMKLVLVVPEPVEYPIEISQVPEVAKPGQLVTLRFGILDPVTRRLVQDLEIVHEKLMHVFLVSENLEFFAHEHPVRRDDGSFTLSLRLPLGGMYRVLADFYPKKSVPQLALSSVFVEGAAPVRPLHAEVSPYKGANLTASLTTDPHEPIAGLETKLIFTLDPIENIQLYLGAWGHMLVASADLIDLLHIHPFLTRGPDFQFNIIFPRAGFYRIWTQFQRANVVNTTVFTIPVKSL